LFSIATKMVAVKDLTPGLIISDAVITPNGKTLLNPGGILTQRAISLLSMWDVNYVYINAEDGHEPPEVEVQLRSSSFDISAECRQFLQEYDSVITSTTNSFEFVKNQNKVPVLALKSTSFAVYSSILTTGPALMDYLLISDYKLAKEVSKHTVMVAYICGLIGKQLNYTETELKALTLAGLLHDIGKMVTRNESIPFTEKAHVINGAQLIKDLKGISDEVTLSVLQHHEYLDGTGFPMGISGGKIHPYAKIIAIANVFHNHSYHEDYCNPFIALNVLTKDMFGKLDPFICQLFTKQVRDSLVNSNIILSDGQEATIIFFPPNSNDPIVRTLDQQLIDLSTDKTLTIDRMSTPEYPL
jgi:putative nucleotidyltransferase with HDIG domain